MWKTNVSMGLSFSTSTPQQMRHDIKVYNVDREQYVRIGQSLWFVWWEILWSREQQQQNS